MNFYFQMFLVYMSYHFSCDYRSFDTCIISMNSYLICLFDIPRVNKMKDPVA